MNVPTPENVGALAKALDKAITKAIEKECKRSGLDASIYIMVVSRIVLTISELALAAIPDPQTRQELKDIAADSAAGGAAEIVALLKQAKRSN
jgi:hypothetical protein